MGAAGEKLLHAIRHAQAKLDNDIKLIQALAASDNVILPFFFMEAAVTRQDNEENDGNILSAVARVE